MNPGDSVTSAAKKAIEENLKIASEAAVERSFGEPFSSLNITQEIDGIRRDVKKLARVNKAHLRRAFFTAYPLPHDYRDHYYWNQHLERIRSSGVSISDAFSASLKYKGRATWLVAYECDL